MKLVMQNACLHRGEVVATFGPNAKRRGFVGYLDKMLGPGKFDYTPVPKLTTISELLEKEFEYMVGDFYNYDLEEIKSPTVGLPKRKENQSDGNNTPGRYKRRS